MRFRLMVERDFAVMATRRQGGKESIAKSEANAPLATRRVYIEGP